MRLNQMAEAVADSCGVTSGRITTLVRRLQDADMLPKGIGGSHAPAAEPHHIALLLLAELSQQPGHSVAEGVRALAAYEHDDHLAGPFLTAMLRAMVVNHVSGGACRQAEADVSLLSCVTVHGGQHPAVVMRFATEGDPVEWAFTPGGRRWEPELEASITTAATLPGAALAELARTTVECLR